MIARLLALALAPFAFACAEGPATPASDELTYQGVTIRPGDVINMHQGDATIGGAQTYGHTALYLGISPVTRLPTFLDFSTWKDGMEHVAFHGRILAEGEFLRYSARSHNSFDVFRHARAGGIDKRRMWDEACRIAMDQTYFFERGGTTWVEVCSSAAARALSAGLGENVLPGAFTSPDEFEDSGNFSRLTGGRTIAFEVAIREANRRAGIPEDRPPPPPRPAVSRDRLVEVEPSYVTAVELKKRIDAAGDRVPPEERLRLEAEFAQVTAAWEELMERAYGIAEEERRLQVEMDAYNVEKAGYDATSNPTTDEEKVRLDAWCAELAERARGLNEWNGMVRARWSQQNAISSNWVRGPVGRFNTAARSALGQ